MIGIPKKHFRELLLHPKYGLCVYIVNHLQTENTLLRLGSCDYEGFFAELFSKGKDNWQRGIGVESYFSNGH